MNRQSVPWYPLSRLAIFSVVSLAAWMTGPVAALLLLLGITWFALRREGESFSALGLNLDSKRCREFAYGVAITSTLFAATALVRAYWVGASWNFGGVPGVRAALIGLPIAFLLMASEELAFRGYGFRQLISACGARTALIVSSLAFGLYHLAQTGFGMWGIGAFWVVALPALGGFVFGLAMIRTGGLALPLGLHLGGNWVQASLFRFGEQPGTSTALFTAPLTPTQAQQLWSPDLPAHLPYLVVIATAALLVLNVLPSARLATARGD